jgi:hypothetical protein
VIAPHTLLPILLGVPLREADGGTGGKKLNRLRLTQLPSNAVRAGGLGAGPHKNTITINYWPPALKTNN